MSTLAENEFPKPLGSSLPYGVDWTDYLEREGITSPLLDWEGPQGITLGMQDTVVMDGRTIAVVWVSGGQPGNSYRLRCRVRNPAVADYVDFRSIVIHVGTH